MNFKWKKTYETNIKEIDDQHKIFFTLINDLYKIINMDENEAEIESIMNQLLEYSAYHFEFEEEFLKDNKYPKEEYETHKVEHNTFKEKIIKIKNNNTVSINIKAYQLAEFLRKWLVEHILVSDKEYSDYFKGKRKTTDFLN